MLPNNAWRVSTHPIRLFGGQIQVPRPVVANGVIVWLDRATDDVELSITTPQGNFTVRLGEIPYGTAKRALDSRAAADRVPPAQRLTQSGDGQDYAAAAAGKDGSVSVAWMEFKRDPDHDRLRRLVKLGITLGAGLEGAVHAQVRNALAEGATGAELRHVAFLGITTIGFPASISGLTWMNDLLKKASRKR